MKRDSEHIYKVLVLDMQPIDPPVGGGRLRLIGLYHALGKNLPTMYVGTYDWPGEKFRDHYLSETLREIDIPLSGEHFNACNKWQSKLGGETIIDSTFHQLAHLSPEYVNYVKNEVSKADIVIFSHPWVYPLIKEDITRATQLVVYDSQNVEGFLRYTLLDDNGGPGTAIAREVVRIEHELCHFADLVLVCSHEDRELFQKLYEVPFEKIRIVPNGVFTRQIVPSTQENKSKIKKALGLDQKLCAIFIGSSYAPNIEATNFICDVLAPGLPDVTFIIAGGVGEGINKIAILDRGIPNIRITGFLDDKAKLKYLAASDIAINPMFGGSGTNIKMFDFMAAALPVVTTSIGARGIETGADEPFEVCNKGNFISGIKNLINDTARMSLLSGSARKIAEEKYSWEHISAELGTLIQRWHNKKSGATPFFSVIIPTYERHDLLFKLMNSLQSQTFRDFEVVVIDQSKNIWPHKDNNWGLDLLYIHTDVKGAVKARNKGAFYAGGEVIAYIDDDCILSSDWLEKAKFYFEKPEVVGVEGLIKSDKMGNPNYRTVSNVGFEGIGFMTANLFLRIDIFNAINGFDEAFDNPHFREDTDLGWRALEYGRIPFARDVQVFHPPHPRDISRESVAERNKFFEKDALLLKKHPERYKQLFLMEGHWKNTPGFLENFFRGAKKYKVNLSEYDISEYFRTNKNESNISNDVSRCNKESSNEALVSTILRASNINLTTKVPFEIITKIKSAERIVEEVRQIIGSKTHGHYFESSVKRYIHYFSAAMTLEKGAKILDVGNAPGHVAIGLYLLGMNVQGINLNDLWNDSYPSPDWLDVFKVIAFDIKKANLPFEDNLFDAVYFTEILEHIAITDPSRVLTDIKRVLKPDGLLVFSTPNICNISNIHALMNEINIYWKPEIFYGSLDRHNREFTPNEVRAALQKAGFVDITMYGINCDSNWRNGTGEFIYELISQIGDDHPLLRNTIMVLAKKKRALEESLRV